MLRNCGLTLKPTTQYFNRGCKACLCAAIFAGMEITMDQLVADFPAHLRKAVEIADKFKLDYEPHLENVLICGLGGSGIGGTILSQLLADHCSLPIVVSKDYEIPAFVNEKTVVIACSYSGNTEETIESLQMAMQQGAQIACISSGGTLSDLAVTNGWPLINVPGGFPPRAAFGFSIVQLFKMAEEMGLTINDWRNDVFSAIELLEQNQETIKQSARQLAESIQHKTPVIYSAPWLEGVSTRWRQQVNENAKMLCWHHNYPEQNHNELVAWAGGNNQFAVIFLTSDFDHPRVRRRMELTAEVYTKKTPHIHHCTAIGDTRIEQAFYLIHLGDWMSVHLANLRGVDSIEVDVISWLKSELAKF